MNRHSKNAAQRTGNEGYSSFAFVSPERHSRHKSIAVKVLFTEAVRYGTKAAKVSGRREYKSGRIKKKTSAPKAKTDLRILKTRNALGDALVTLMQEKKFEEIKLQDVLDLAEVGRSTFYVHYRDKDDLFLSDVEDFLNWFPAH